MVKSVIRLLVIMLLIMLWVLNPIPFVPSKPNIDNQTQFILQTRGRAFDKNKTASKIPKSILEKYFPDWSEQMDYQNRQFNFLQSSKKKLREADKLRLSEDFKLKVLKPEEKNALDYFCGTGFYKYYQDINTPLNIFDTRDTFLKKMQDFEMRNKFLKAYNRRMIKSNSTVN
jgi:hypothetical protein